jgi:Holliday junction DNA helicase RuvA
VNILLEFIQGELLSKSTNSVVVKVGGWGCRLYVSALTQESLPSIDKVVILYTHLYFREDEFSLFGFLNTEERETFIILISVSGIGPKLALSILSKYRVSDLKRVIVLGDTKALVAIPGVGKKTADRIILELKDKIGKQELVDYTQLKESKEGIDVRKVAIAGLISLGYSLMEAEEAVPFPDASAPNVTAEEMLRKALKQLAKY